MNPHISGKATSAIKASIINEIQKTLFCIKLLLSTSIMTQVTTGKLNKIYQAF